ncbi:MAG TPA: flagellar export protein FliJ [Clostridiales bacterium]|nr:flagellar export protein FliJ [Clostridiales bacterium]
MKKFVFSLEKVLSLKQQLLDVQVNEMMRLQERLKQIVTEIQQLNETFHKYNKELNKQMSIGITPQEVMVYKMYFHDITQKINVCTRRKQEVEKQIALKKEEMIALKTDISGLEKLQEKQRQEYNALLHKQQELEVEEYVNRTCTAS